MDKSEIDNILSGNILDDYNKSFDLTVSDSSSIFSFFNDEMSEILSPSINTVPDSIFPSFNSYFEDSFSDILKSNILPSSIFIEPEEKEETLSSGENTHQKFFNNNSFVQTKRTFIDSLKTYISMNDFEYGFKSKSEIYVSQEIKKNGPMVREWLNDLFNDSFSEHDILLSIIKICGHLEYSEIKPQGITMAVAALSHKNPEINEAAIRCFENWEAPENIGILKSIKCHADWIEEYKDDVIQDLEESCA